jgi:hypothetical protein
MQTDCRIAAGAEGFAITQALMPPWKLQACPVNGSMDRTPEIDSINLPLKIQTRIR